MNPDNYKYLAQLLEKKIGLVLGDNKSYLLTARLTPLAEKYEIPDLDALVTQVRSPSNTALLGDVIDAMTTNETSFFRDGKPFDVLFGQVLPKLMETRASVRKIKIWNAASSSGQEPYSIVMGLLERLPQLASWNIEVVATDISSKILEQAQKGVYNHFEVQRGLPVTYLVKYFAQQDGTFELKADIRNKVKFQKLNLMEPFGHLGQFDIIFCRNVLIYFDPLVKKDILDRMTKIIKPDGYVFLGGTETILGVTDTLKRVKADKGVVYCIVDAPETVTTFA